MAKVIIVGAGVAGISAGIYARLAGYDAVIFEKHHTAGGNLSGWRRGEYFIDNCIHWLTGTNKDTESYKIWEDIGMLGDGVEIFKPNVLYTVELDGQSLSFSRDIEKLEDDMVAVSAEDEKESRAFIGAVKAAQKLLKFGGGENKPTRLLKYLPMTMGDLADRFKHPLLKRFFTYFLGEKFGALAMLIVGGTFCSGDADIPYGGSVAAAERIVKRYEELGGELVLGKEVVRADDGKVIFADGSEETGDYVIITADPAAAAGRMVRAKMPRAIAKRYKNKKLIRFSSVQCALAAESDKKLFEGDIIISIPDEYREELGSDRVSYREYYHEKDFAPEGKSIYQSMIFIDEEKSKEYISLDADRVEYKEKKRRIGEISRELFEKRFPELSGKVKCIDVWTPATYKRFTGAEVGSFMSFLFPKNYIPLHVDGSIEGHPRMFYAGQWLCPPGGLPNAAKSGKLVIEKIKKLEQKHASHAKAAKTVTAEG